MSDPFDELSPEYWDLAWRLGRERDVADGHVLERVLRRLEPARRASTTRTPLLRRPRVATAAVLVTCLGLNVSGAFAAALTSVGVSSSSANSLSLTAVISSLTSASSPEANSAANAVYGTEKPGCGNEHNDGVSGNSGAHGGQPPKAEERGQCPHEPGTDGN